MRILEGVRRVGRGHALLGSLVHPLAGSSPGTVLLAVACTTAGQQAGAGPALALGRPSGPAPLPRSCSPSSPPSAAPDMGGRATDHPA